MTGDFSSDVVYKLINYLPKCHQIFDERLTSGSLKQVQQISVWYAWDIQSDEQHRSRSRTFDSAGFIKSVANNVMAYGQSVPQSCVINVVAICHWYRKILRVVRSLIRSFLCSHRLPFSRFPLEQISNTLNHESSTRPLHLSKS